MTSVQQQEAMIEKSITLRAFVIGRVGVVDFEDVLQSSLLKGFAAIARRGDTIVHPKGFFFTIVEAEISDLIFERIQRRLHDPIGDSSLDVFTLGGFDPRDYPEPQDERSNPEQIYQEIEDLAAERALIQGTLDEDMPGKSGEILGRFYFQHESKELIKAEMGLSQTRYRLLKSRSKEKLVRLQRRKNAATKAAA